MQNAICSSCHGDKQSWILIGLKIGGWESEPSAPCCRLSPSSRSSLSQRQKSRSARPSQLAQDCQVEKSCSPASACLHVSLCIHGCVCISKPRHEAPNAVLECFGGGLLGFFCVFFMNKEENNSKCPWPGKSDCYCLKHNLLIYVYKSNSNVNLPGGWIRFADFLNVTVLTWKRFGSFCPSKYVSQPLSPIFTKLFNPWELKHVEIQEKKSFWRKQNVLGWFFWGSLQLDTVALIS